MTDTNIIKRNKDILLAIAGTIALLLIPLIAMEFTTEVDWNAFDFIVMGTLILATGLGCVFVRRKMGITAQGIFTCLLIVGIFLLIWAELAVGVIGTPFAGS